LEEQTVSCGKDAAYYEKAVKDFRKHFKEMKR